MANQQQVELAEHISGFPPVDDDGDPITAVLTKFILIAEWIDAEGSRYITRRATNGEGDSVPSWDVSGLLVEALFGDLK